MRRSRAAGKGVKAVILGEVSEKRSKTGPPPGVEVSITRGSIPIGAPAPGTSKEEQFLAEIRTSLGVDASDLDRPFEDFLDELTVVECVAVAEAVWGVELGPRTGTVSEVAGLAYEWPTLRALMNAASKIHDR